MTAESQTWRKTLPLYLYQFNTQSQITRLSVLTLGSAVVFFIFGTLGYLTAAPSTYDGNLALALSSATTYTFMEILLNNLFVGLLAATLGGFILPALALLVGNGFQIGDAIGTLAYEYGAIAFILTPHGLFELPAFFFATAAGFRLSTYILARFTITDDTVLYHIRGRMATDYSILIIVSALCFTIAAIIETTYTLELVRSLTV